MKACISCKTEKDDSEFYKNSSTRDRLSGKCKACDSAHEKDYRKSRILSPERKLENSLRKRSGLTIVEYDMMAAAQGGKCGICETQNFGLNGRFCIDHDHKTGFIRGLLCHRCNRAIGHFGDDVELLEASIKYLKRDDVKGVLPGRRYGGSTPGGSKV